MNTYNIIASGSEISTISMAVTVTDLKNLWPSPPRTVATGHKVATTRYKTLQILFRTLI